MMSDNTSVGEVFKIWGCPLDCAGSINCLISNSPPYLSQVPLVPSLISVYIKYSSKAEGNIPHHFVVSCTAFVDAIHYESENLL